MTAPTQQQPASTQPPPDTAADAALVAALAAALLTAATPEIALGTILSFSRTSRVQPAVMLWSIRLVMSFPPETLGAAGSASLMAQRQNYLRRAQFALAAARRGMAAIREARSQGRSASSALAELLPKERRYFAQHLDAIRNRAQAAMDVDMAALRYGPLLGWNTIHDSRTSPECAAADGKNFRADVQPRIGWPGAVHLHCRCYPGPARIGARMLPSVYEPARMVRA
jgi:hypothetical protein